MNELVVGIILILGALLVAIAALGVLRMPDLFLRMSTATKGSVVGLVVVLLGCALYFGDVAAWAKATWTVVLMVLTLPVAAHMIGRAGYFDRTSLWEGTVIDELSGKYHPESHELLQTEYSGPPEPEKGLDASHENPAI